MKAYEIDWGKQFLLIDDPTDIVYTMQRGNGIMSWVTWEEGGETKEGSCYIGEEVIPYDM